MHELNAVERFLSHFLLEVPVPPVGYTVGSSLVFNGILHHFKKFSLFFNQFKNFSLFSQLSTDIHTLHPCIHTYIHAYVHTYIHTCIHTYLFIHTYTYRYYTCTCMYAVHKKKANNNNFKEILNLFIEPCLFFCKP